MNTQRIEIEINTELLDAVQKALGTQDYSETVAQALRETILGYRPGRMTDDDREHIIRAVADLREQEATAKA